MTRAAGAFVVLMAVISAWPARADEAMTAAANAFYTTLAGVDRAGGIPNASGRIRLQPLLTPELNKMLADAAAAEGRFAMKNKNAPPIIEGDLFSSLFEGPTGWKVGACLGDDRNARCAISLTRQDPGKAPVNWIDTLVLVNNNGWKVTDIAYDANFAFGNTGTLRDMLTMTLHEAP